MLSNLRTRLALAAAAALLCLAPVACSSDGPTTAPAGARHATTEDSKTPSSESGDSAVAPACRDNGGTIGTGTRC